MTGPGGVGKTRIIVEVGRLLAPEFLDGIAFVSLADVTDPADFIPALAEALDVKEAEERTLGEGIVALIGDRKALLLLDNLEQVVAAAPEVARAGRALPGAPDHDHQPDAAPDRRRAGVPARAARRPPPCGEPRSR